MQREIKQELLKNAANGFRAYLAIGSEGAFQGGWDRLRAMGLDVDLRREATNENAKALLWTAENQLEKLDLE